MQRAYMGKLLELAEKDERVIQLLADSGTNFDEVFKRNFPNRLLNFGIAEQNTVGAAAGMAMSGLIPFVFLQGAFIVYRAMEFVRNDVCFQNANVKLISQGSGTAWSALGPSHHTTEDTAVLRSLPNLQIYAPATPVQVRNLTEYIYKTEGPCYMRIGMNNEQEFFEETYVLPDCGFDIVREGESGIVLISTGSILEEVMNAAEELKNSGISVTVISVFRIKPFDEEKLICILKEHAANQIVTIEEHQIYGGLGSIVSEALINSSMVLPLMKIGFQDTFAKGYSPTQKGIRIENELDGESIARRIADGIKRVHI